MRDSQSDANRPFGSPSNGLLDEMASVEGVGVSKKFSSACNLEGERKCGKFQKSFFDGKKRD